MAPKITCEAKQTGHTLGLLGGMRAGSSGLVRLVSLVIPEWECRRVPKNFGTAIHACLTAMRTVPMLKHLVSHCSMVGC